MENKEVLPFSVKSDTECIFDIDSSSFNYNNEIENFVNVLTPPVANGEADNSDFSFQNDILSSSKKHGYISYNTFDFNDPEKTKLNINRFSYSDGDKLNSLSECDYDFEQGCKYNNGIFEFDEPDDNVSLTKSSLSTNQIKDEILKNVMPENKEMLHEKSSDIQKSEKTISEKTGINKQRDDEIFNTSIEYYGTQNNINYNLENEESLENGIGNLSPRCNLSFSNGLNNNLEIFKDDSRSDIKNDFRTDATEEIELRHNECALTNDFFETVENINLKILEKQNNLKDDVEELIETINKSNFENRINAMVEISNKTTDLIEQFKKKSENCIRQCRKFETASENLIGECINTLSQASVCYADWVCLHASDLKQIDKDLENIQLFIGNGI